MTNQIERRPRKLIVACDGTWMNSDLGWEAGDWFHAGHPQIPSNVTRICRAIEPEDEFGHPQIIYYQNGLGSSGTVVDHVLGGGLALGLSENIRAAYGFLANNYLEKDLIYFVGFSRGAFTARSIAGMVAKFGLLEKSWMQFFYDVFEDWEGAGEKDYKPKLPVSLHQAGTPIKDDAKEKMVKAGWSFAKDGTIKLNVPSRPPKEYLDAYFTGIDALGMTRKVKVTAVGVFDTVGSLGLPVRPFFQKWGLAPSLHKYRFYDTGIDENILNAFHALALDEHRSAFSPTVWEKDRNTVTNLKQVWFSGVHCSVGGGDADTGLSDITLAWMMSHLNTISKDRTSVLNIHFKKDFLPAQIAANKKWCADNNKKWGYGLGGIENSYVFPTSIAGKIDRTPDGYHKINYATGKEDKGTNLVNTNEYIHASVRARMLYGGTNYDGKTPYFCAALGDTKSKPVKELEKRWIAHEGAKHKFEYNGKYLEEDELGVYENEILDEATAKKLFGADYKGPKTTASEVVF